ncbi:MAG: hypothetical protein L7H13_03015 [Sulfolobales archaeon]|nr:hypothetical protein [Sulfolobales archaeon]MCG2883860.1 hypothetical protein [Sulfolobales archaeon]
MTLTIETSPVETIQVDSSDVYRLMVFREAFKEEFKLLSLVWKYGQEMDSYILTRLAKGGGGEAVPQDRQHSEGLNRHSMDQVDLHGPGGQPQEVRQVLKDS